MLIWHVNTRAIDIAAASDALKIMIAAIVIDTATIEVTKAFSPSHRQNLRIIAAVFIFSSQLFFVEVSMLTYSKQEVKGCAVEG